MADKADIVIGANFGDEGKGLITDYLAARAGDETLVVRHNGGAQAGHTVTTPDGRRHVFKHFGSGSFVGAKTYLSRFYACNPLLFFKEMETLISLGVKPVVYADPQSMISTPYDMMINQMVEEHRGASRHGSCGVGFGETIARHKSLEFMLSFNDLNDRDFVRRQLEKIRTDWVPQRLLALGIDSVSPEWKERLHSQRIFDLFLQQARDFVETVRPATADILVQSKAVVFEGAQGLLLDQDYGWFPHVTRSYTGIKNAVAIAKDAGIDDLNAVYITRAYNTRHGAGPMPHETAGKPYADIVDMTNIYNEYQGGLRFGWLDLDLLSSTIYHDMHHAVKCKRFKHSLAMSCIDQVGDEVSYIYNGQFRTESVDVFLNDAMRAVGVRTMLASRGPTRRHISLEREGKANDILFMAFQRGAERHSVYA